MHLKIGIFPQKSRKVGLQFIRKRNDILAGLHLQRKIIQSAAPCPLGIAQRIQIRNVYRGVNILFRIHSAVKAVIAHVHRIDADDGVIGRCLISVLIHGYRKRNLLSKSFIDISVKQVVHQLVRHNADTGIAPELVFLENPPCLNRCLRIIHGKISRIHSLKADIGIFLLRVRSPGPDCLPASAHPACDGNSINPVPIGQKHVVHHVFCKIRNVFAVVSVFGIVQVIHVDLIGKPHVYIHIVGSEGGILLPHLFGLRVSDGHDGNDGSDSDDNAQHGQKGTKLVRRYGGKSQFDIFSKHTADLL